MYITVQPPRRRRGLGAAGTGGLVSKASGSAGSAIASAGGMGAWAGPIGAGVGALVGIIAGLWSAHNARAKGARDENTAMDSAVQAFDGSLHAIFAAANAGQISETQAVSSCQQLLQYYWAGMAPYSSGPGRADSSHGGNCAPLWAQKQPCGKSCTAGCCVGCTALAPTILDAVAVFQKGGGTLNTRQVFGSGYGGVARGSYSLTYKRPPAPTAVVAAAASGAVSEVSTLASESFFGVPGWMLMAGGAAALWYFSGRH